MGWKDRHAVPAAPAAATEQPAGRAQLVLPMPGAEPAAPDAEAAALRAQRVAQWLRQVEDNWSNPAFLPHPGHLMAMVEKATETGVDSIALRPAWVQEFARVLHDKLLALAAAKVTEAP